MNKQAFALGLFCFFVVGAQLCRAEPQPSYVDLKELVNASDYIYVCRVDRIKKILPTKEHFERGEFGRLDMYFMVVSSFKGAKNKYVQTTVELYPHGPSVDLVPINTNDIAVLFLQRTDEEKKYVFADRWYPLIKLQTYYADHDSKEWTAYERIIRQLRLAVESDDPDEIQNALYWLKESKQTASQLSEEKLWELASSQINDIQILALNALVRSGATEAIDPAIILAINIHKDAAVVNRDNLGSLLWYIAARYSSRVPKNLAQKLSECSDPIIGGAGRDILRNQNK